MDEKELAYRYFNNGICLGMLYGTSKTPLTREITKKSFETIWKNDRETTVSRNGDKNDN